MNSPSVAIIWELWRKNRWGFALLAALMAVCAALSLYVARLKERVIRLEASVPRVAEGTLASSFVLPSSPSAPGGMFARSVQFKLGLTNVVYEGTFSPGDCLTWTTVPGKPELLRLSLGAMNLFEGAVPPDPVLSWTTADGAKGRVPMKLGPQYSEEAALATAIAQTWRENALTWSMLLMGFSFLVVFAIFGCAEPHSGRGFTGIPPRRFTLPVHTGVLVAGPIVAGCLTTLVVYFVWSRLVLPPLLADEVKIPNAYFAVLLPASLVLFQSLVWGLPSFPRMRVCLITVLVLVLVFVAALPFELQHSAEESLLWIKMQPRLVTLLTAVWTGGVAAAWLGVRRERHGGWSDWKGLTALGRFLDSLRPRPPEFRSAIHAQFWIEFRRNGRVPLFVWTILMCVIIGDNFVPRDTHSRWATLANTMDALAVVAGLGWVAITSLNLARDGGSKRLALSSFTATRPLGTGSLLTAKLLAGAAIWTAAAALLGASLLIMASRSEPTNFEIPDWSTIMVALLISLHLFVGILPLLLSGRIAGFPWSLLPLLIVYGGVLNVYNWLMRHGDFYGLVFLLLVALVFLKLLTAYWGFRRAIGSRSVSIGFTVRYIALWCLGTGILLFLAYSSVEKAGWTNDALVWIPGAMLALPLARIALSPLALAMNRRR